MTEKIIARFVILIIIGLLVVWWYRQRLARKRFVTTIKTMAEIGKNEINGQSVDYWLNILNQESPGTISTADTSVLRYKGQEFFFLNGDVGYLIHNLKRPSFYLIKACFLVAVGQPAVRLLSEQEQVFRRITGSAELAAFSIYQWPDFLTMLISEKRSLNA